MDTDNYQCYDTTFNQLRSNDSRTVLRVVEELDDLLMAFRLMIRSCERHKLHGETHALELSAEILLRRRNYILNVSSSSRRYDSFPCESCHITYPTTFIMSWLKHILSTLYDDESSSTQTLRYPSLCKNTCSLYFDTPINTDHMIERSLYPLGLPYTPGPVNKPPSPSLLHFPKSTILHNTRIGECDETEYVYKTLRFVSKRLRKIKDLQINDNKLRKKVYAIDIGLAESAGKLLRSRRHFGFDMDCVNNTKVNSCRARFSEVLLSYGTKTLEEIFQGGFA